ncbi:MAG: single-stranded DNA-binding protein [Candidatus Tyrphobacter sp.]
MKGSLEIENALGMKLHVAVESEADAYEKMREFGSSGWTSGDVPSGGFILPYDLANRFDWRLIGAKPLTLDDEQGVMHRGRFYKRREMPEKKIGKTTLPACVKYSRGAKPTDAPEIRESAPEEGVGLGYVTLVTFRGRAPIDEHFVLPRDKGHNPMRGVSIDPRGDEAPASADLLAAVRAAALQRGLGNIALCDLTFEVTNLTHDYRQANEKEAHAIFDRIAHLKVGVA